MMPALSTAQEAPLFLAPEEARRALAALDRMHCKLARDDANAFCSYVLRDEAGRPVVQSTLHERWHRLLDSNRRALVWAHVEAGKTTQLSIGRVLWELGRNPGLRFAIVMNTAGQAERTMRTIVKYAEESAELRRVFPGFIRDPDAPGGMHCLYLKRKGRARDPSITITGLHGNVLGARFDRLILDDFVDYESSRSPAQREDTWHWYMSTLETRLTRDARVWCVGTAWHRDDFMHRFAKSPGVASRRYPVLDDMGRATWPEQWPEKRIAEKRAILGPVEFSRQLLCVARTDEDSRFRQSWIDACVARGEGRSLLRQLNEVPPGFRVYTGVDLATKKKGRKSDLSVLFTIAVHPNEDRQVLEVTSGRWGADEIVKRIIDTHRRFRSVVIVEDNATQQHIIDITRAVSAVPVQGYTTTGKVHRSPEFGIESMAVEFSNEKWIIPSDGGRVAPEIAAWIQELLYYAPPAHAGDRLMASWFAREAAGKIKTKVGRVALDMLRR